MTTYVAINYVTASHCDKHNFDPTPPPLSCWLQLREWKALREGDLTVLHLWCVSHCSRSTSMTTWYHCSWYELVILSQDPPLLTLR